MTTRADQGAAGLAELLVGDAVAATRTLGRQLSLRPRADELARAFPEIAALRLACAELAFEEQGAQFQRIAAPALLRRELVNELRRPARLGTARRRFLKPLDPTALAVLVDQRKQDYAAIATPEGVADGHCRRLMELTGRAMADAPGAWMAIRQSELRAVHMSRTTATNLVEDGWFDAE